MISFLGDPVAFGFLIFHWGCWFVASLHSPVEAALNTKTLWEWPLPLVQTLIINLFVIFREFSTTKQKWFHKSDRVYFQNNEVILLK